MSNVVQIFRSQSLLPTAGGSIGIPGTGPTMDHAVADVLASTDFLIRKAQELSRQLAVVDHAVDALRECGLPAIHQKSAQANSEALALAKHALTLELQNLRDIRQQLPNVEDGQACTVDATS